MISEKWDNYIITAIFGFMSGSAIGWNYERFKDAKINSPVFYNFIKNKPPRGLGLPSLCCYSTIYIYGVHTQFTKW